MNYNIIQDEKILREFIDWLPKLKDEEKYYFCLFARNKYCRELTHIKSDKAQLKRFVTDKERMFHKIQQLQIEEGTFYQRDTPVPQGALALYMTVNPRNMWKASVNTMVKLATAIRDQNILMNPHQEALSEIQKAKSRTCYIDFDIDIKSEDISLAVKHRQGLVLDCVNEEAVTFLRTRGGLHVLVNPEKVDYRFKATFYKNLMGIGEVDQAGDNMIPVPGCTQGGYVPHFINL